MTKFNHHLTLLITATLVAAYLQHQSIIVMAAPSPTPEASDSAEIDSETIKENIKKRIEEVVKTQTDSSLKKVAITGSISTITTTSFSVETSDGVRQASMSAAATTPIDLTTNKEVALTDVGIGDYVAALGYLSDTNKVLDARRILIMRTPPGKPTTKLFFGTVQNVDVKKKQIEVANSKINQQKTFLISTKTDMIRKDPWNHQEDIVFKDITVQDKVLIIYEALEDDRPGKITSLTLKSESEIKPKILEEVSASPKP